MSSFGSAIERWNIKSTGVVSGLGHSERILPVRSITLVDSAYSSFSGNLYISEYQNSFQPDSCHFNDEQLSYMDVEYVRAIYNPSVVDQDGVYHDILSEHGCSEVALSGRTGSTFSCDNTSHVHRTSPAKLDNCVSNMSTDQVSMKCIYEDPLNMKDRHNHPNNSVFVPNHKAYGHQQNSPTEINILQEKENQMYNQSNYMEIKDNYFGRCFDVIRADGEIGTQDSCTQNSPYCSDEYRITQYAGTNRMSKEHFKGNDLQKTNEENTEGDGPYLTKDGQFVHGQYLSDVSFKNIRPSHKTSVSGKIGACAKKGNRWIMKPGKETHCSNSEGTIKDTEYDDHEQNIRKSRLGTRASQTLYYESNEDVSCPRLKAMNSMNDVLEVNNAPSFQKDATVKSIPLLSQQLQQEKPKSHPLSDLNCEKITKATTPMLYHLAGGRHSAFIAALNNTNAAKQEKLKLESKTFDKMNKISILQQTEPRPDNHKLPKNKSLTQLADLHDSVEGGNSGNLNSLAEECLMNDYIEKLKVAQKKVLRETSFKRKDLQMSLPCRFKLNPPKRPTIDHFRSYSSSSANEESRFLQTKSSVDSSYKKDDTEKVAVPRIGGRKRITKEQKKLCYSEPEKLDHLGIQKSNFAWKEEPTISNKREMSDSDITANRIKYLESKERTTSSSSLSKTELKQIQHNALVEYMERKTNQRPNSNPQVQMEKTPGLLNYNEWNIYSSETGSVDASQKYLRRRSAGASSSYDATVTWNDRFGKTSPLGRSAAEQTAGLQFRTFSDQRTFDGSQETLEGSSPSLSQKTSTSTHHEQVLYVNIEFLPSTLSKSHIHNDRLTIPGDSTSAESGIICVSKSRGKSMEEIGTTDIVKLAELSHSSDQLYHIKRSVISSRLENTRTAAASHQDKLLASTQNETGNLTRQTHQESVLGPRRSDLANLEQEAHSWPLKASAVSSDRDNSCSSSPSAKVQPWASEPLQCLETEDEVFTRASIVRNEESSSSAFSYLHNTGKPVSEGEATALSFSFLPEQGHLEHLIVSESATSSEAGVHVLDDAAEKDMITQHPETSKVDKPLDLTADNREVEGDGELMQPECIDSSQQLELSSLPSSQVNKMQTAEPYLGHDINSGNEDTMEQKTEDLEQKSKNPEEEDDLPKVKLKSPEDERREELVKEIVAKDKSLMNCLQPVSVRESAINIMKSLFPMDFTAVEKSRTRGLLGKDNRETLRKNNSDLESISKFPSKITTLLQKSCVQRPDGESLDDITLKKMELLSNIGSKLEDLCEQREYLLSDICMNTTNGNNMQTAVKELCKPNEFERYMMFIGDLEKVVSLLFSLSARLTRVENALSKVDENTDAEEMQSLKERHNLLSSQREDAKDLKANLDRREQVVTGILVKYLNEEQLQDYKHFVRLKTSLLIEQKNLEEKIKLYEEQFESIHNSILP